MTLFVLLGPTAVGKTDLSIKIAQLLGSPIINCDSRQLFRDMRIGTAAPTPLQLSTVTHYFVGTLGLRDYYSAAKYEEDVIQLTEKLSPRHPNLLLSGGSMMYIDAVCNGIDDIPTIPDSIRQNIRLRLESEGLDSLCEELRRLDPEYHAIADLKNHKRIVHALEICHTSGQTYTSLRKKEKKLRNFSIVKIGLRRERQDLFHRIGQRVDMMMKEGLLQEAQALYPFREANALNTVGYKELFQYMEGAWTLDTAIERIKKNTRVYAKKQMTWFQRDKDIRWFHPDEEERILAYVKSHAK